MRALRRYRLNCLFCEVQRRWWRGVGCAEGAMRGELSWPRVAGAWDITRCWW